MRAFGSPSRLAMNLLAAVGKTPLVELDLEEVPAGTRLFAKLESCNPGGSIKDRPVARMLAHALEDGAFEGGRALLDASTGNAGVAYAMFGAALGIDVTLVVPANTSPKRLDWIAAHGAELVLTDAAAGYEGAVREAERIVAAEPERYWFCNQHGNEHNWRAHYESTGDEILAQTMLRAHAVPAAFVAGIGTGGSLTGIGRRLREASPEVHIAAVIPAGPVPIEGLNAVGQSGTRVPPVLDETLVDERIRVGSDQALDACRRLARAGLLVGPSSGAHVHAALGLCTSGDHPVVVTILCDTGERYGAPLWNRAVAHRTGVEPSPGDHR